MTISRIGTSVSTKNTGITLNKHNRLYFCAELPASDGEKGNTDRSNLDSDDRLQRGWSQTRVRVFDSALKKAKALQALLTDLQMSPSWIKRAFVTKLVRCAYIAVRTISFSVDYPEFAQGYLRNYTKYPRLQKLIELPIYLASRLNGVLYGKEKRPEILPLKDMPPWPTHDAPA